MEYVRVKVRISNIERLEKSREIELIAYNAIYTIVKRKTLEELGIKPIRGKDLSSLMEM